MGVRRQVGRGGSATATAVVSAILALVLSAPVASQSPAATGAPKVAPTAAPSAAPRTQSPRPVVVMPPEVKRPHSAETRSTASVADQYCQAVLEPAREARYAYQAAELQALGKDLDDRLAKIEARIAELKEWVARREDFASRTSDQLVTIYSGMRPEAASEQLTKLDESSAAAILAKLAPRVASQILNDMPSDKAARLAMILMGASRKSDPGGRS
ncbi:MAG: MotE family protein [Hyphomicrobiaceae bacterium]